MATSAPPARLQPQASPHSQHWFQGTWTPPFKAPVLPPRWVSAPSLHAVHPVSSPPQLVSPSRELAGPLRWNGSICSCSIISGCSLAKPSSSLLPLQHPEIPSCFLAGGVRSGGDPCSSLLPVHSGVQTSSSHATASPPARPPRSLQAWGWVGRADCMQPAWC